MALFHRDLGDGDPVVLLHPGPGLDGSVFLPGVERLANAGHRVILVDLPGSGRSPAGDWTVPGQAAAIQAFAEELELRDWTLYGHSFGGYVAAQHLVDHGTAARLILACTDVDEEPAIEYDPFADLPPAVEAAFEREATVQTPEECRAGLARPDAVLLGHGHLAHARRRALPARGPPRARARRAARAARARGRGHPGPGHRRRGRPLVPAAVRAPDRRRPRKHGELLLVPGGHFPFAEDPESYWDAVADWLSRTR